MNHFCPKCGNSTGEIIMQYGDGKNTLSCTCGEDETYLHCAECEEYYCFMPIEPTYCSSNTREYYLALPPVCNDCVSLNFDMPDGRRRHTCSKDRGNGWGKPTPDTPFSCYRKSEWGNGSGNARPIDRGYITGFGGSD